MASTSMYLCIYTYTCTSVAEQATFMCICIYIYIHTCMHVYAYAIYVHMCTFRLLYVPRRSPGARDALSYHRKAGKSSEVKMAVTQKPSVEHEMKHWIKTIRGYWPQATLNPKPPNSKPWLMNCLSLSLPGGSKSVSDTWLLLKVTGRL